MPTVGPAQLSGFLAGFRSRHPGVELYATVRTDREDRVQSMVLAGLGFAFMPEYSVTSGNLCTRPLVDPAVERSVVAVEVRGRARSPATSFFFEALHAHRWLKGSAIEARTAQV